MDIQCQPDGEERFLEIGREYGAWIARQMDLVGGWLQEIQDIYSPKTYGYFSYTPRELDQLRIVAEQIANTYVKIAKFLKAQKNPSSFIADTLTAKEQNILNQSVSSGTLSPATIRADIVFASSGDARIVEVNTDNVAGLENLFLYHSFFGQSRHFKQHHDAIARSLGRLLNVVRNWLDAHYNDFLSRSHRSDFPPLSAATVAIVYDDRDHCFFLARVLAEILRGQGINAIVRRPENILIEGDLVCSEGPFSKQRDVVHVIWRHWLFFEVFDAAGRPRVEFSPIQEADTKGLALVVNPIKDRLLFSKSILAQLLDRDSRLYSYTTNELRSFIAETRIIDLHDNVVKPLAKFGGEGVLIGDTETALIAQKRIDATTFEAWYANSSGTFRMDLFSVHGLLIYVGPDGKGQLGGVMGRAGPHPVVNFAKGAQVFGALTP